MATAPARQRRGASATPNDVDGGLALTLLALVLALLAGFAAVVWRSAREARASKASTFRDASANEAGWRDGQCKSS